MSEHAASPAQVPAGLLARLPKVDLHFHMAGTLRPATLAALARKYDLPLPRPLETLYTYRDFYDFIDVLRIAAQAIRVSADFERVAYEAVEDAVRSSNARHVEMSFTPSTSCPPAWHTACRSRAWPPACARHGKTSAAPAC